MPAADLIIVGSIRTVDDLQPTAEVLKVSEARIPAPGRKVHGE